MDWGKIMTYGLIGLVTTLVMSYMNNAAGKAVEKNALGYIEIRMNRLYQISGLGCLTITSIFLVAGICYNDKEMYITAALMFFLFGGLGAICLLYYHNHVVKFNDETIIVKNWKGKKKEIKWAEIYHIEFNAFSGYLKLSASNTEVCIHQHLVGLKELVKRMEEKTRWTASGLKLPIK